MTTSTVTSTCTSIVTDCEYDVPVICGLKNRNLEPLPDNEEELVKRVHAEVTDEGKAARGSTGWSEISNRLETLFPEALLASPTLGTLRAVIPYTSLFAIGSAEEHVPGGLKQLFTKLQELCASGARGGAKLEFSVGQVDMAQLYAEALAMQRPNERALSQLLGRVQARGTGTEPARHSHLLADAEAGEEPLTAEELFERARMKKQFYTLGLGPLCKGLRHRRRGPKPVEPAAQA